MNKRQVDKNHGNIFVVGSGYLGKHLLSYAKKTGYNAFGISRELDSGFRLNLGAPKDFDYGLIRSEDILLLTAAISSPDYCSKHYDQAWKVNVTGTSEFIKSVLERGAKVIFFSSDTVYGERKDALKESDFVNPAGEYAEMKWKVEERFLDDPLFKSIRLSYVFSREDKFTKYLIDCQNNQQEAEVFHPFDRAVIHRDDVVEGVFAVVDRWDEFPYSVINFGGPELVSRTMIADELKATAIPNLKYLIVTPTDEFFFSRPKMINMTSPLLALLLKRPAKLLRDVVKLEFN